MKKNKQDDRLKKNNPESDEKPEIYAVNNNNESPGINRRDFLAKSIVFPVAASVGIGGIISAAGCKKDDEERSDYKSIHELSNKGSVDFLGIIPNYNMFFSAQYYGYEPTINFWSFQDWKIIKSIYSNLGNYSGINVNKNGTVLATGHYRTTKLWSLPNGLQINEFQGHVNSIYSLAFHPELDLLASSDGEIYLRSMPDGTLITILEGSGNVMFSPDGNYLITGDGKIWQMPEGSYLKTIEGATGIMAINSSSNILVTADQYTIKFWNFPEGSLLKTLNAHSNTIRSIALSPDNKLLASGGDDNEIKLWTFPEGNFIKVLSGHLFSVTSLVFSPDGNYLLSGSADSTIKIWAIPSGQPVEPPCSCDTVCTCDTVSNNNNQAVCTCNSIQTCTCNMVCTCNSVCSCVSACSCDGDSSSHYWYPS